ncbi:MAG: 30S ribosomal protein S19 [Nanoarchaeota archaeon]|nr:30S ribosomal protein S19 [Nanoarchaeota archaeon]
MEEIEARKKDFTYRGKGLDELKTLEVREFAKHLRSRQRRNVLRQFRNIESFISKAKTKIDRNKAVKTHHRDLVIVPSMVGMKLQIYNGKTFVPVIVVGEMIGHKFGEFALTRNKVKHGKSGVGATKGSKHKSKK